MANDATSLKGKSVLITGGTRGIGFGIAEHLVGEDCRVLITGRNESDVEKAAAALNSVKQGSAIGVRADVRNYDDMVEAVNRAVDAFGKLDVVIANAGVGHFAPIEKMTQDMWRETMDINLTGVFNTTKAGMEALKASEGYLITLASLAGTNFFAGGSAYVASKFGVVGFTQSVMLDVRQQGVKVTTIMPGSVASHFNGNVPGDKDDWKVQPEDIGQLVASLLRMPARALPSKVEIRPTRPPVKN